MHLEHSVLEVSGDADASHNYSVQLCAEAGAASEADAKALLKEIKMTFDDKILSLSMPEYMQARPSSSFVEVQAPLQTPITLNSVYAGMRVIGMDGPVHISTTHGRITLLDTTGDVDARVESGIIDFSGHRGHVHLEADWEINLNFTAQNFDGSLDAKAQGPVRILLPSGFTATFEAIVQRKSDFVCRADISNRVSSHKRDGKWVFRFGSGDPSLHFISLGGPVVMDNPDRLAPFYR
jgi:hypothetical protein